MTVTVEAKLEMKVPQVPNYLTYQAHEESRGGQVPQERTISIADVDDNTLMTIADAWKEALKHRKTEILKERKIAEGMANTKSASA